MTVEQIEERLKDVKNEIHYLDSLKETNDNIKNIDSVIDDLLVEKDKLIDLLESSFDNLIGL